MIVRNLRLVGLVLGTLLLLAFLYLSSYRYQVQAHISPDQHGSHVAPSEVETGPQSAFPQGKATEYSGSNAALHDDAPSTELMSSAHDESKTHRNLFSLSSLDQKYFSIDFTTVSARNPNIIPHPTSKDTWLVIAQQVEDQDHDPSFQKIETSCSAAFQDGALRCITAPSALPIATTPGGRCEGDLAVLNLLTGPHDARAFWGPQQPYLIFGSNSMVNCLGQFTQALGSLVSDGTTNDLVGEFRTATELQRPPPLGHVEKNWFFFWDSLNKTHAHYDVAPKRVFARVNGDGSSGPDLATEAQATDEKCLAKHLPHVNPEFESIHQATNSLKVTLCERTQSCVSDNENTFIFTIFQHKTYQNFHAIYEPYVLAFRQQAPFELYGISKRPFWISGRDKQLDDTSEMFYITSMSWKSQGQRYHGYMDDTVFLAFGIEDKRMGVIDVSAKDLFADLELC